MQRFNKSYDEIEIKENSLIYCDIPYRNTDKYLNEFDYERFYGWCRKQKELVIISEYSMPDDRFVCVAEFAHRSTISSAKNLGVTERLFVPVHQERIFHGQSGAGTLFPWLFSNVRE